MMSLFFNRNKEGYPGHHQITPVVSVHQTSPASSHATRKFWEWKCLCIPTYRCRMFGNKGVAIMLLWSFAAFSAFDYLYTYHVDNPINKRRYIYSGAISAGSMLLPIVGLLADVCIGRYRVIKSCLIVMWLSSIFLCMASVFIPQMQIIIKVSSVVMAFGIGGFQVNIVQFSVDQLVDSSSVEIVSFISWYVWTYFASKTMSGLVTCFVKFHGELFPTLFVSIVLTFAISLDFLFNHWLVKEPVVHNPLKLIFKVLKYATRNKYPRLRSAFTYWDDKLYSRIDLAKRKFGGPFTAKQVEDVKSFFRIVVILSTGCLFFGVSLYCGSSILAAYSSFHRSCWSLRSITEKCLTKVFATQLGYQMFCLGIPLYEFIILPVFWKYLPSLRVFIRMALGALFIFIHLLGLISVEVVGHFYPMANGTSPHCIENTQLNCSSFDDNSYYWPALLSFMHATGQCLILTAGIEFICSQTPYSMKGLMFGSLYTALGVSVIVPLLLFLPFQFNLIPSSGSVMGCIFWYLVSCSLLVVICAVVFTKASHSYKSRQRDDDDDDDDSIETT